MRTRGSLSAALVVAVALPLAACGSSGGSDAAAKPTASVDWFQVRPVLTEAKAAAADCATTAVAAPPRTQELPKACSADGKLVYSLGPAVVTQADSDGIGTNQDTDSRWYAEMNLTAPAAARFATTTGELARQTAPSDAYANLVDGVVVSTVDVLTSVTSGQVQVPLDDNAKAEAFSLRVSDSMG